MKRHLNSHKNIDGPWNWLFIINMGFSSSFRPYPTSCLTWIYFHRPSCRSTGHSFICMCVCIDPHSHGDCWLRDWYTPTGQSNYPDSPLPMSVGRYSSAGIDLPLHYMAYSREMRACIVNMCKHPYSTSSLSVWMDGWGFPEKWAVSRRAKSSDVWLEPQRLSVIGWIWSSDLVVWRGCCLDWCSYSASCSSADLGASLSTQVF